MGQDELMNWRTDKWKWNWWNWRTDKLTNWRTDEWKWNWRTDELTNENETDELMKLMNWWNWRTDEWKWNWWSWWTDETDELTNENETDETDELTNWRTDKWKWAPPCETEEGGKKGALCPPSPENKKRSCLFLISKVEIRNKQPHCLKFYNLPHPINTEP